MRQHDRIAVHIDNPRLGGHAPGDLVDVVLLRHPGPDIEKLPDAGVPGEVTDDADEDGSVRAGISLHARQPAGPGGIGPLGGIPVHLEVRLAAQQEVIRPRHMRNGSVDLRDFPLSAVAGSHVALTVHR